MKLDEYKMGDISNNTIRQYIDLNGLKIILLDDSHIPPTEEGCKNLLAIDKLNNIVWIAELPAGSLFASYWTIEIKNNGLSALSGSFRCTIDTETGKIINQQFVK
jgi:hypothetical protein